VEGFADARDGTLFRLRFSPDTAGALYRYRLTFTAGDVAAPFDGEFRCAPSAGPGPVVVDRERPRHFRHAGSGKPYYLLGQTAYHLLDPSNSERDVDAQLEYCRRNGFNRIRFLLTGYPRDFDRRPVGDAEFGVQDPVRQPNYGAPSGTVNALPAWEGEPRRYDFTRFNVAYWRRVDRAVRRMRERGIQACAIFTIEKQNLPRALGRLTEHERRLYRYAVARLAAFDNVWWDLGNEHNEYRDREWGEAMGRLVKEADPYDRLLSAHAYETFLYPRSPWADFVITQHYGDERTLYDWVLRHAALGKPYVNEEYGYEGEADRPGHSQNASWTRRSHWSIAMAGGYATYGDWSRGRSYYYMGDPGPGEAGRQLRHLRTFFEALPFDTLAPQGRLVRDGLAFCLGGPEDLLVVHLPRGGRVSLDLPPGRWSVRWYDPRVGRLRPPAGVPDARPALLSAPDDRDWVALLRRT
jgi:hypothetical protein